MRIGEIWYINKEGAVDGKRVGRRLALNTEVHITKLPFQAPAGMRVEGYIGYEDFVNVAEDELSPTPVPANSPNS